MTIEQSGETEYQVAEDFFPWFQSRLITRMLVFTVITVAITAALLSLRLLGGHPRNPALSLAIVVGVLLLMSVVMLISSYNAVKRQLANYRSFRLYVSGSHVRRVMEGYPELLLPRKDIQKIELKEGLGITVTGPSKAYNLWIPERMQAYADLQARLNKLEPLERVAQLQGIAKAGATARRVMAMVVGAVIALAVYLLAGATLFYVFLLLYWGAMILWMRRGPNVSNTATKRMILLWFLWLFILLMHLASIGLR